MAIKNLLDLLMDQYTVITQMYDAQPILARMNNAAFQVGMADFLEMVRPDKTGGKLEFHGVPIRLDARIPRNEMRIETTQGTEFVLITFDERKNA